MPCRVSLGTSKSCSRFFPSKCQSSEGAHWGTGALALIHPPPPPLVPASWSLSGAGVLPAGLKAAPLQAQTNWPRAPTLLPRSIVCGWLVAPSLSGCSSFVCSGKSCYVQNFLLPQTDLCSERPEHNGPRSSLLGLVPGAPVARFPRQHGLFVLLPA